MKGYGDRTRNGLLAIYLPNAGTTPDSTLQDNIESGYAVTMKWDNISWQVLTSKIDEAFNNRSKEYLVKNSVETTTK